MSTYPLGATQGPSDCSSIAIKGARPAAIEIARGGSALRTQKADIASVAGLERFDLKFSRLGWVSFLLSQVFSAHSGGGKFKLLPPADFVFIDTVVEVVGDAGVERLIGAL